MAQQGTQAGESAVADRVVLSYPADLGDHGVRRINQDYYKKFLTKVYEEVAVGDQLTEFTDIGCCGSQMEVLFRVEAIKGGTLVGETTEIDYEVREACGLDQGWSVQQDEPNPT